MYLCGRYQDALKAIDIINIRLGKQHIYNRYVFCPTDTAISCNGMSLERKFSDMLVLDVVIYCTICVKEFELEHGVAVKNNVYSLEIPPRVMLHTLEIFCYNRIDPVKRQEALHQLYFLVHFDKEKHVPKNLRDISFELLGICQEMCGDYEGSLNSLYKVLDCDDTHKIREASHTRIQNRQS
jgi:hypothetical protein